MEISNKTALATAIEVGKTIRHYRELTEFTQRGLGMCLSNPQPQQVLSKIERGKKIPNAVQMLEIAHLLNVDVSQLYQLPMVNPGQSISGGVTGVSPV